MKLMMQLDSHSTSNKEQTVYYVPDLRRLLMQDKGIATGPKYSSTRGTSHGTVQSLLLPWKKKKVQ
jgi:hypothetical protein